MVQLSVSGNLPAVDNKVCRFQCPNLQQDDLLHQAEQALTMTGWLDKAMSFYHLSHTQTVTCFSLEILETRPAAWKPWTKESAVQHWLTPTIGEANQRWKKLYWSIGWCKGQEGRWEEDAFCCQRVWFVSEEGIQHPFLWDLFFFTMSPGHSFLETDSIKKIIGSQSMKRKQSFATDLLLDIISWVMTHIKRAAIWVWLEKRVVGNVPHIFLQVTSDI